jgi:hypothetical protein
VGLGLSDWEPYALRLAQRLGYTNTFFDLDPRLDITAIGDRAGELDFLIATEVFEHVAPPVSHAFENAARLLKDDGVFVFTVPYDIDPSRGTIEHFPELHDYHLEGGDGTPRVLVNRTRQGATQRFSNPVFHGGDGVTLEMRVFAVDDLLKQLRAAGFRSISIMRRGDRAHGIVWQDPWSLPILAGRALPSRLKRAQRRSAISESAVHQGPPGAASAGSRKLRRRLDRGARRVLVRIGLPDPLFDAAWYRVTYPDVPAGRLSAWIHWRRHGWREGRDPNPLFDTDWYLRTYPDVANYRLDPLSHYALHGAREGRDPGPGFDTAAYLERYPDVRLAGVDPLLFHLRHGATEGRVITPRREAS